MKTSNTYRIRDNIAQLQLRFQFRHVKSLLRLPKFELERVLAKKLPQLDSDEPQPDETVYIKWQQKILSEQEMELYSEAHNCQTEVQKRYHDWLKSGGGARYCETDTSKSSTPRSSSRRSSKTRKRSKSKKSLNKLKKSHHIFTYVAQDEHVPLENNCRPEHTAPRLPSSNMYIYVMLQSQQHLLVELRWYAREQLLYIYPDFNNFREQPHLLRLDTDYCHLYAYGLENVSPVDELALEAAAAVARYEPLAPAALLRDFQASQIAKSAFDTPPPHMERLVLLLELREARHFACAALHVRYHTLLPAGVSLEQGLLQASTPSCYANAAGAWQFGYNWQLTLLMPTKLLKEQEQLLHIFFELISIDSWERERIEGYAHCALKLTNADSKCRLEVRRLHCLRPVASFMDGLRRYFIGGRQWFDFERFFLEEMLDNAEIEPHVNDIERSIDMQADSQDEQPFQYRRFHARFGSHMQYTGQLWFSCQRLRQRHSGPLLIGRRCIKKMTTEEILETYNKAKKQLDAIMRLRRGQEAAGSGREIGAGDATMRMDEMERLQARQNEDEAEDKLEHGDENENYDYEDCEEQIDEIDCSASEEQEYVEDVEEDEEEEVELEGDAELGEEEANYEYYRSGRTTRRSK